MFVPRLEVADIFRAHGPTWRHTERGHLSLGQLKVMSAIEQCRSAALGGHVLRCSACAQPQIAYNSCRNRHCPKCQGSAAQRWLEARAADLLPVDYYHVVFTLPAPIMCKVATLGRADLWSHSVALLAQDEEFYVFAESHDRIAKERGMRRRRLEWLWARLKQL